MQASASLEREAARTVVRLMAAAARTSPKTRGLDNIRVRVVEDDASRDRLVARMREIARRENRPGLERDAGNISASPAILVVGVVAKTAGLDCGFCGHPTCDALEQACGVCAFNSMDLGIASASAASVAAHHHLDNRLMYSIGKAALDLGLFPQEVVQALGIPLSVTGKSPFFDRKG
jgi:uncharacterized ferredoxin-like protein